MKRALFFSLVAFAASLGVGRDAYITHASTLTPANRPWIPVDSVVVGSIVVKANDGRAIDVPGAHRVRVLGDGSERWDFDRPMTAEETIAARDALAQDPALRVDVDLWRQAQLVPDDEGFSKQWPLQMMDAEHAWDVETGDPQLVVAVVDTGIVSDHPDLKPRLTDGYDFITDPANAGDGDGRDPNPYDDGDESESSSGFHGSHIAGIIGAASGNGIGMSGVDWRCKLQPVRVLGVDRHRGKDSDIADGIRWAAGLNVPGVPQNPTPAKVINLSFGGPGYSQLLQDAILAAKSNGRDSLVVASAGNDSSDAMGNVPGALEGVLDVAAADPTGGLANYSDFGVRVDVLSPGGSAFLDAPIGEDTPGAVWSTSYVRSTNQYVFAYAAGTSQAAAHASGVAALVRAAAPTLKADVAAAVIRRSAVAPSGGCEQGCGSGLINAKRAVEFAQTIAVARCGAVGCDDTRLAPAPLRPEEGCAVARDVGAHSRSPLFSWGFVVGAIALAAAVRRRRAARATIAVAVPFVALACSCGGKSDATVSTGQSLPPTPTVRIVDPIPTYKDGQLEISVGGGRSLIADVVPSADIEVLELHATDPPVQTFGRLGHAPWKFFLPKDAPGESGGRNVCVTATDGSGQQGETCFFAVP